MIHRKRAIAKALTALLPAAPFADCEYIRTAANAPHMKKLPPTIAVWLATIAHIRHQYTEYDTLRDEGYDKDSAHFFVRDSINDKLDQWLATRHLEIDETI